MGFTERRFGVEVEYLGPARYVVERELRAAGVEVRDVDYSHARVDYWKLVYDHSLGRRGSELVSPPLRGKEGLEEVRRTLVALNKIEGVRVNRSCGLHVHIEAHGLELPALKMVVKKYAKFEDAFDTIMAPSRRASTNDFCRSLLECVARRDSATYRMQIPDEGPEREAALKELFAKVNKAANVNDIARLIANGDRHGKVNLQAIWSHGTIEFRQHGGTTDPDKICHWIRLLGALIERCAKQKAIKAVDKATKTAAQRLDLLLRTTPTDRDVRKYYRKRARELPRRAPEATARKGSATPGSERMTTECPSCNVLARMEPNVACQRCNGTRRVPAEIVRVVQADGSTTEEVVATTYPGTVTHRTSIE